MHVHVYVLVHVIFELAHVICMHMYMYACILQGMPEAPEATPKAMPCGGGGGGRRGNKRPRPAADLNPAPQLHGRNGGGKREVCDPQSCNNTNIRVTPNS